MDSFMSPRRPLVGTGCSTGAIRRHFLSIPGKTVKAYSKLVEALCLPCVGRYITGLEALCT